MEPLFSKVFGEYTLSWRIPHWLTALYFQPTAASPLTPMLLPVCVYVYVYVWGVSVPQSEHDKQKEEVAAGKKFLWAVKKKRKATEAEIQEKMAKDTELVNVSLSQCFLPFFPLWS